MKKTIIIITALTFSIACNTHKLFDGPDFFEDDFEEYTSLDDLLLPDELWSFAQITIHENSISVDSTNFHTGNKATRFFAKRSTDQALSKCSISKQNMAFWEGETVRLTGWYFISGTESLQWLFLMDLEEQAIIGAGPGMRLALVDNKIRVEYKFYEDDIVQQSGLEIDFPRNEWVELILEVKLSQKEEGEVRVWQNGQIIIDTKNNKTLPTDILYSQLGTKGMYSSCEIGITANSYDSDLTLWVDDIKFEKVN